MDLTLFLLLGAAGTCFSYLPRSTVNELYSNLTMDYNSKLKPLHDQSKNVPVYVFMLPVRLLELDTAAQKMSFFAHLTFVWLDYFLIWNSTEYDGIEYVTFKYEEVWHPPIQVGIPFGDQTALETRNRNMLVFNNGTVYSTASVVLSLVCVMDITYYPFDTQDCRMVVDLPYTSWDDVDLYGTNGRRTKQLETENPEWHFLEMSSNSIMQYGENTIHYSFLFRRRAAFIVYTTIAPLVLLSILNACVVLVPVSSGEKGSIAVTLFLSYCVYVTTIAATLPPNSATISLILLYMIIVQIISGLTVLYSIFETNQYIHGNHNWLMRCFLCGCFCCGSKVRSNTNKDNGIANVDDKGIKDSNNDEVLICFKRLDYLVFSSNLLFNIIVVIAFTIMVLRSIRDTED